MTQDPRTWSRDAQVSAAHARLDQTEASMGELMVEVGSVGKQVALVQASLDTNNRLIAHHHGQVVRFRKEVSDYRDQVVAFRREMKTAIDGLTLSVNSAARSAADSASDLSAFKQEVRKHMNPFTALVIVACVAIAAFFSYKGIALPPWLTPVMAAISLFLVSTLKPVSEQVQSKLYSLVGKKKG